VNRDQAVNREILFYYRSGCHLCEEMAAVLQQQWPNLFARLRWCDVDSDPEWQANYGELIPALVLDQELICHYVVEPERINACFGDGPNPV
jgi:hypothetical protein